MTLVTADLIQCTGCPARMTAEQIGRRSDGRLNTRCPRCRAQQASRAGVVGRRKAKSDVQYDVKALRAIERWLGLKWRQWVTPEGRRANARFLETHGMTFEELWTYRIRKHAERRAARERIAARNAAADAPSTMVA